MAKAEFTYTPEMLRAMEFQAQRARDRRDLYFALRSRVLSDVEMARVAEMGTELVEDGDECYRQSDVDRAFNEALLQQFKLRRIAQLMTIEGVAHG